jgi:hypothetical protein
MVFQFLHIKFIVVKTVCQAQKATDIAEKIKITQLRYTPF